MVLNLSLRGLLRIRRDPRCTELPPPDPIPLLPSGLPQHPKTPPPASAGLPPTASSLLSGGWPPQHKISPIVVPWLQHLPHPHCTPLLAVHFDFFLKLMGFCFAVYCDIHGTGCTTPSPVALSEARPGSAASGVRVWHGTLARGWFSSFPISSRYSSSWMFNCRSYIEKYFAVKF
ncbi:hypothetical protein VPH35_071954 [Triticum aestivum]